MKKIKIKKKLQQYQDLKLLKKIASAYEQDKYQEVLELCQTVIFSESEEISRENRDFWYFKAIAMDCLGNSLGAMEVFRQLLSKYPNNPLFLNSFQISCRRVEQKAREAFQKDAKDPILIKYYNLFEGMWNAPYFLHVAHAKHLIQSGHKQKAKDKMMNLLKLSPGDEDFIEYNLELASEAGDKEWFDQVQKNLRRILVRYPSRFELYPLLVNE